MSNTGSMIRLDLKLPLICLREGDLHENKASLLRGIFVWQKKKKCDVEETLKAEQTRLKPKPNSTPDRLKITAGSSCHIFFNRPVSRKFSRENVANTARKRRETYFPIGIFISGSPPVRRLRDSVAIWCIFWPVTASRQFREPAKPSSLRHISKGGARPSFHRDGWKLRHRAGFLTIHSRFYWISQRILGVFICIIN